MILERDKRSMQFFVYFLFKMGEVTLCVYADGNFPVERGKLMMQEKEENWVQQRGVGSSKQVERLVVSKSMGNSSTETEKAE